MPDTARGEMEFTVSKIVKITNRDIFPKDVSFHKLLHDYKGSAFSSILL